jgi:uncharacterized protein
VILLDTTILAYAVGRDHPLRDPCRRLLAGHARRAVLCTTTVEVVQEFLRVHARSRPRPVAAEVARRYSRAFDLIGTTPDDLARGLELFEAHPRLGAFDAVLAGVALNHGVEALVSADRAFAAVPGLRWVDPTSISTRLT